MKVVPPFIIIFSAPEPLKERKGAQRRKEKGFGKYSLDCQTVKFVAFYPTHLPIAIVNNITDLKGNRFLSTANQGLIITDKSKHHAPLLPKDSKLPKF